MNKYLEKVSKLLRLPNPIKFGGFIINGTQPWSLMFLHRFKQKIWSFAFWLEGNLKILLTSWNFLLQLTSKYSKNIHTSHSGSMEYWVSYRAWAQWRPYRSLWKFSLCFTIESDTTHFNFQGKKIHKSKWILNRKILFQITSYTC